VKPKKRPSENQVNLEDRIVGNQKRHENAWYWQLGITKYDRLKQTLSPI
jgi:hypothetical protein